MMSALRVGGVQYPQDKMFINIVSAWLRKDPKAQKIEDIIYGLIYSQYSASVL